MKLPITIALALVVLSSFDACGTELPRATPEEQGVSSAQVLKFVETADKQLDSLNSFMLLRHGHVVAEGWWSPYHREARHSLYSLSKSFTSTAVGLAVAEGKLSIDDPVIKFFPEELPAAPSDNLKAMRISDLLRMSTGHQTEPPRVNEIAWTKSFLAHPVPFKPGTHFLYNTSATYMQSAIVQKATGATLLDYLRPRLFEPLGIQDPVWETSPQGVSTGGYGLSLRTEDIARFGQLYLQKGQWEGKQLVPESWIREATARQVANGSNPASDWDVGYGYQFWRCRHGAYRGDGAFGQYCIVLPEQDAVIAITSGLKDMQAVLNLVWDHLLPAFQSSPLEANQETAQKLKQVLHGLMIRPQIGTGRSPGIEGRKYVLAPNEHQLEAVQFDPGTTPEDVALVLRIGGVEYRSICRKGEWTNSRIAWGNGGAQPVAVSGAWTANDTFTAKFCFVETPFILSTSFKFKADEISVEGKPNVGFGPATEFKLLGITSARTPSAN